MGIFTLSHDFLIGVFLIGYLAIIFEFFIRINKSAVALIIAGICWLIYFVTDAQPIASNLAFLSHHLGAISEILFFLIGAMTLVELIDSHKGFNIFVQYFHVRSKRKLLWVSAFFAFFLSAVLDNLTTTILMVSLLRKLIPYPKERLLYSCMVVVAANAGGAWTPIGDVTTTMLWIEQRITTTRVVMDLFFPSLVSLLIPLLIYTFFLRGQFPKSEINFRNAPKEPGGRLVFILGVCSLLFVPLFRAVTGMPPYMGILIALAILWIITDIMHHKYEQREHLRIPYILTKIDASSVLFFLGMLLSVSALKAVGILDLAASWVSFYLRHDVIIAGIIGITSAIIDNVPLVAATIGMYDLQTYPIDSHLWLMIAYAAGTGGSLLIMGSSAGVALMGIERVHFFSYLKRMTLPVFVGFIIGLLVYIFFI